MRVPYFEDALNIYRLALMLARAQNHVFKYGFMQFTHTMDYEGDIVETIVNYRIIYKDTFSSWIVFEIMLFSGEPVGNHIFGAEFELPRSPKEIQIIENYIPEKWTDVKVPSYLTKEKIDALENYLTILLLSLDAK